MQFPKCVAVDTETTGLNTWKGDRPFAAGAAFPDGRRLFWYKDFTGLREIMEDPTTDKVLYNAKFDMRMLETVGIETRGRVWDPMIFCHLLDGRDAQGGLSLDATTRKYLPANFRKLTSEVNRWFEEHGIAKNKRSDFSQLPKGIVEKRVVGDADLTIRLFHKVFATVMKAFPFLVEQEHKLIHVTKRMEDTGLPIDMDEVEIQAGGFYEIVEDVRIFFEDLLGTDDFNLNSRNDQLKILDLVGLMPKLEEVTKHRRTPKGAPKLDDINLRGLHHPVPAMMIAGKVANKFMSTYLGQMAEFEVDGYVHPQFNPLGTITGRFSCSKPNLMNMPIEGDRRANYTQEDEEEMYELTGWRIGQHTKRIFPCRPGYWRVHSDKSKAEIYSLAHYTEDPILMKIMREGLDIYDELCRSIFSDYTKGLRTRTKKLVFGYLYGASIGTQADLLEESEAQVATYRRRLEATVPGLPRWSRRLKAELEDRGYVENIHGRRYYISPRQHYKAINAICQGTVGDEVKSRMVAVDEYFQANPLNISAPMMLLLMVHDDLGMDLPEERIGETLRDVHHIIEETSHEYLVPMPASVEATNTNWGFLRDVHIDDDGNYTPESTRDVVRELQASGKYH